MTLKKNLVASLFGALISVNSFAANQYEIMIPSYFAPSDSAKWDTLVKASKILPVTAIVNPNSGPGTSVDPEWVSRISSLKSAGVRVIGYVATGYGKRDHQLITNDLRDFSTWYDIDGFFLDEFQSDVLDQQSITNYTNIVASAKSFLPVNGIVVGNPGINADERLISEAKVDVIVNYEDVGSKYTANMQSDWTNNYLPSNFADMVYSLGDPTIAYKKLITRNVRYVYLTGDGGSNPWDTTAAYILAEASMLSALGSGTTIDFDTPTISYTTKRISKFDRPPSVFNIKPYISGGLAKERAVKFAVKVDDVAIDTKGRLLPVSVNSSGDHTISIVATTPLGKTITHSETVTVGTNQLPSCISKVTWDKLFKGASVRLSCADPDGKIKSVKWFLDGVAQTKTGFYFTYIPNKDGSLPSLSADVVDDSGGTQKINVPTEH